MPIPAKRLHQRPLTVLQVWIGLEVLWMWGVGGPIAVVNGIHSCRLVHKEVVEVGSNYKKSYFWWPGNLACGDSTGSSWIRKVRGCISARLDWGKGREGAVHLEHLQIIGLMVIMLMSYVWWVWFRLFGELILF